MNPRLRIERAVGVQRILWMGMNASQLVLFAVGYHRALHVRVGEAPLPEFVGTVYVMAAAVAIASFVAPAGAYRSQLRTPPLEVVPGTPPLFVNPNAAAHRAVAAGQASLTLAMALSEAVSLLGFVLVFQGAPLLTYVPLFAAGIGLTVLRMPSRERCLRQLEAATGATLRL